jgi:hypothetical protein
MAAKLVSAALVGVGLFLLATTKEVILGLPVSLIAVVLIHYRGLQAGSWFRVISGGEAAPWAGT